MICWSENIWKLCSLSRNPIEQEPGGGQPGWKGNKFWYGQQWFAHLDKQGNERLPDPCLWVHLGGGVKNIYEIYELA